MGMYQYTYGITYLNCFSNSYDESIIGTFKNILSKFPEHLPLTHYALGRILVKPDVHLIVTIVTVAVIAQKQSISAIAEPSPSHVHSIVLIVQNTSKILFLA